MALKDIRTRRGYTQRSLSKLSGVPRETINRTENGVTVPDIATVVKLAKALDCTCDDIINGLKLDKRTA